MIIIWNKYLLKKFIFVIILFTFTLIVIQYKLASNENLPKNFYFKKASLTYRKKMFYLKDEPFQILSGSIHYFRVPPDQWKKKLKYLKSAGLNTVETYCPWNLHEERKGLFNFEGNLNIRSFVQMAHDLGLFVILRPGPYICGELEFGGLPSWLLSDPNMKIRSMYIGFMVPVEDYLRQLLREINDLQHSNGGPIIAFQIENEYGTFGNSPSYMQAMKEIYVRSGVVESMFISNDFEGIGNQKKIDNVFYAINTNKLSQIDKMAQVISALDPESPIFISELFTGWFQSWQKSNIDIIQNEEFKLLITSVLKKGYSFNLYMFHGGTNFGFMNGGSNLTNTPIYVATSYDYNAPLSEDGIPNKKFFILRKAILNHLVTDKNFKIADVPELESPVRYGDVDMTHILELDSILELVDDMVVSYDLKMMEELPINGKSGQNFGFIVYRTEVTQLSRVVFSGNIRDRAIVLYQYEPLTNYWKTSLINSNDQNWSNILNNITKYKTSKEINYLDFLIENMGRFNYANFQTETFNEQRKGMKGTVFVGNKTVDNWKIYPLEFKKPFIHKISASSNWKIYNPQVIEQRPRMYKSIFIINEKPSNTHLLMSSWTKGVVFINGYNLGRYWNTGPTQSLFLPKSFLRYGENEIIIFELHIAGKSVILQSRPVFLDSEPAVFN